MSKRKQYQVIYADPPWPYNQRVRNRGREDGKQARFGGGVSSQYPLMSVEEICRLPISEIAEDSAVLFLWVTFPRLDAGLQVIKAWGFEYKTLGFSWIKLNKKNGKPFFGTGYYTKSNCEVCLFGTRGKVLRPHTNKVSSCVLAARREHSRKPDEVYHRIELLYPVERKIELFARHPRNGWDAIGYDLNGIDIRTINSWNKR